MGSFVYTKSKVAIDHQQQQQHNGRPVNLQ